MLSEASVSFLFCFFGGRGGLYLSGRVGRNTGGFLFYSRYTVSVCSRALESTIFNVYVHSRWILSFPWQCVCVLRYEYSIKECHAGFFSSSFLFDFYVVAAILLCHPTLLHFSSLCTVLAYPVPFRYRRCARGIFLDTVSQQKVRTVLTGITWALCVGTKGFYFYFPPHTFLLCL